MPSCHLYTLQTQLHKWRIDLDNSMHNAHRPSLEIANSAIHKSTHDTLMHEHQYTGPKPILCLLHGHQYTGPRPILPAPTHNNAHVCKRVSCCVHTRLHTSRPFKKSDMKALTDFNNVSQGLYKLSPNAATTVQLESFM